MFPERVRQFLGLGGLRHFWKGYEDFLFCKVNVLQTFVEQFIDGFLATVTLLTGLTNAATQSVFLRVPSLLCLTTMRAERP
jgi:hypothetical protein